MCLLIFDELRFVLLGQACEHQPKHGQIDHGLTAAGLVLIVLAHAPVAADPSQRAFDHPAAWQMTKAASMPTLPVRPKAVSPNPRRSPDPALASRSRGFPSLGEVLVELGEGAYSMLEDGIINIRTIHFFAVDGELIPGT